MQIIHTKYQKSTILSKNLCKYGYITPKTQKKHRRGGGKTKKITNDHNPDGQILLLICHCLTEQNHH